MVGGLDYLIKEAIWSFAILLFCGAAGLGPISPFRRLLRFPLLGFPPARVLVVNIATLGVYFTFHVSYGTAALVAAVLCQITSIVVWLVDRYSLSGKDVTAAIAVLCIVAVCFAWLSNTAAIKNGEPSIVYFDG